MGDIVDSNTMQIVSPNPTSVMEAGVTETGLHAATIGGVGEEGPLFSYEAPVATPHEESASSMLYDTPLSQQHVAQQNQNGQQQYSLQHAMYMQAELQRMNAERQQYQEKLKLMDALEHHLRADPRRREGFMKLFTPDYAGEQAAQPAQASGAQAPSVAANDSVSQQMVALQHQFQMYQQQQAEMIQQTAVRTEEMHLHRRIEELSQKYQDFNPASAAQLALMLGAYSGRSGVDLEEAYLYQKMLTNDMSQRNAPTGIVNNAAAQQYAQQPRAPYGASVAQQMQSSVPSLPPTVRGFAAAPDVSSLDRRPSNAAEASALAMEYLRRNK